MNLMKMTLRGKGNLKTLNSENIKYTRQFKKNSIHNYHGNVQNNKRKETVAVR